MSPTIDVLVRLGATVLAVPAMTFAVSSRAEPTGAPVKACAAYRAGQEGVIRTFCSGRGVAHIKLDGREHVVSGGVCDLVAGSLAFNAGVVLGPAATVSPDYFGVAVPKMGPFSGAVLAVRLDGRDYLLMQNSGAVDAHGGSFQASGHVVGNGREPAKVSGTFTC